MERIDGKLVPITIEKAIERIKKQVRKVDNAENVILVSPEMTNEAMYMIQKWGRVGLQTNSIGSPYFINRTDASNLNKNDILPLQELEGSKQIFVLGGNLPQEHPVISHLVQNNRYFQKSDVTFITTEKNHPYSFRTDHTLVIQDIYYFIKAVCHYLVQSEKMFGIFVNGLAKDWNTYRDAILKYDYAQLIEKAGVDPSDIEKFAQTLIDIPETAFIFSEKNTDEKTMTELKNLMLLTEKQGKTYAGMIALKPACNTQGLFDMGIYPDYGPGFRKIEGTYLELLKNHWHTTRLSTQFMCPGKALETNTHNNLFVFGLDLIKDTPEMTEMIKKAEFICVQSLFENETTAIADLVLPMNFAIEIGGSYTSTFKVAQSFRAVKKSKIDWNDYQFYGELHKQFGIQSPSHYSEIFLEMISLLQPTCCSDNRHIFTIND